MKALLWMVLAALGAAMWVPAHAAPEQVVSKNGVALVSGGIGVDSQQRLKALEPQFNLKLVFTLVEGNYVSDVAVTVRNAAGKVLVEHVADGPFLLVKLPAGRYDVAAVYGGTRKQLQVNVREGRLQTEYVRWPSNPATDFPLPPEHAGATAGK